MTVRGAGRPRATGHLIELGRLPWLIVLGCEAYFAVCLVCEIFWGSLPFYSQHHDFLAFYSVAYLTLHEKSGLMFDQATLVEIQRLIVPHSVGAQGFMPFLNPPFVGALLSPLALASANVARAVWLVVNLLVAVVVILWTTSGLKTRDRLLSTGILLGTYPVYQTLVEGQLSILLMATGALAILLAQKGHRFSSGTVAAAFWAKPQLALLLLGGLLLFRQWRYVSGMALSSLAIVVASIPFVPLHSYGRYLLVLKGALFDHFSGAGAVGPGIVWEGALSRTEGINGLWTGIFGQSAVLTVNIATVLLSSVLVASYLLAVRRQRPGFGDPRREMMLVASLSLALLLDPHLYPQDVVLIYVGLSAILVWTAKPTLIVLATALVMDAAAFDQVVPLHILTLVLVVGTLFACWTTIGGRPPRWSASAETHLSSKNDLITPPRRSAPEPN